MTTDINYYNHTCKCGCDGLIEVKKYQGFGMKNNNEIQLKEYMEG